MCIVLIKDETRHYNILYSVHLAGAIRFVDSSLTALKYGIDYQARTRIVDAHVHEIRKCWRWEPEKSFKCEGREKMGKEEDTEEGGDMGKADEKDKTEGSTRGNGEASSEHGGGSVIQPQADSAVVIKTPKYIKKHKKQVQTGEPPQKTVEVVTEKTVEKIVGDVGRKFSFHNCEHPRADGFKLCFRAHLEIIQGPFRH